MSAVVSVNDFIDHLKENNLVIVNRDTFVELRDEVDFKEMQEKLLKQPALTPYEIAKFKLTHYTTLSGVKTSNLIKPEEFFKDAEGKLKVAMCAIKRIRKIKHL